MEDIFTCRISVPQGVLVREIAGESVLLNLHSESYFGLDETGTRMWAALVAADHAEAAFAALLDEYDVPPDRLRADLSAFVGRLRALGLIDVVET